MSITSDSFNMDLSSISYEPAPSIRMAFRGLLISRGYRNLKTNQSYQKENNNSPAQRLIAFHLQTFQSAFEHLCHLCIYLLTVT